MRDHQSKNETVTAIASNFESETADFSTPADEQLTLIIALRCDDFAQYKDRLSLRRRLDLRHVHTIIVDDGSPRKAAKEIQQFCADYDYEYHYIGQQGSRPFSLSRARNVGLLSAKTEWVCFEDADLTYRTEHYQQLLGLLNGLDQTPFNFVTVPAVYMTEEQSQKIFEHGSVDHFANSIISAANLCDPRGKSPNDIVETFSPATSIVAVKRQLALIVGGFDEQFAGWGGEDRDFAFRLLLANEQIEKPSEFPITKTWNLNDTAEFKGWRALFKMMGDFTARHGVYAFHLHHEILPWRSDLSKANINLAAGLAKHYHNTTVFRPLADAERPTTVVLGKNPHILNSTILSLLDNPVFVDDDAILPPEQVLKRILNLNPARVLMWNPYGQIVRREVYQRLKDANIEVVVGERGALPNSFYFDIGGFCVESPTYKEENLPKVLTEGELTETVQYVSDIRYGANALEAQSNRIGAGLLRLKTKIPTDRKIIFCPLQVETDTTTTLFSEEGREYSVFLRELEALSLRLPADWVLAYKNHPLSKRKVTLNTAICLDDFHVNDALEASTCVALFNSGVGVLSMAFEKPVLHYGPCFYALEGVNYRFETPSEVVKLLDSGIAFDRSKSLRFLHNLRTNVYSYATSEYEQKETNQGRLVPTLSKLNWISINLPWLDRLDRDSQTFDLKQSVLFDAFRFSENLKTRKKSPVKVKPPVRTDVVEQKIQKDLVPRHVRKLAKLRRSPKLFFSDARLPFIRPLAHLFPK